MNPEKFYPSIDDHGLEQQLKIRMKETNRYINSFLNVKIINVFITMRLKSVKSKEKDRNSLTN